MGLPHDPSAVAVLHRHVCTFAEISHQKNASGGCERAVPQHHGPPRATSLQTVALCEAKFALTSLPAGTEYVSLEQLLQESDVSGFANRVDTDTESWSLHWLLAGCCAVLHQQMPTLPAPSPVRLHKPPTLPGHC